MLSPATRSPWVPSNEVQRGNGDRENTLRKGESCIKRVTVHPIRTEYGRDALNDTFGECAVAKANEADCGAQTLKSKHREEGGKLHLMFFRNAGVSGKRG